MSVFDAAVLVASGASAGAGTSGSEDVCNEQDAADELFSSSAQTLRRDGGMLFEERELIQTID